jgi:glycosyltransferase involved in cell wall biosynthesis
MVILTGSIIRPTARSCSSPSYSDYIGASSSTESVSLKFSIVTPVFNGMPWLPECVESVAAQRADVEVEHLVLDGGSTDGSREWLRDHAAHGCVAVFEPDAGQTDALVKGFERATGDVFGWLNADDLLEAGALARVATMFEAEPDLVLVGGCCLLIDGGGAFRGLIGTPPASDLHGLLTHIDNPPQPATFFRAEAYRRAGGLDRRYDLAMDVDLWLKLARLGRFAFLPRTILARFRVHDDAKSVRAQGRAIRQDLSIRRRNGLSLRSEAAAHELYRIYVSLPLRSVRRVLRWAARRLLAT